MPRVHVTVMTLRSVFFSTEHFYFSPVMYSKERWDIYDNTSSMVLARGGRGVELGPVRNGNNLGTRCKARYKAIIKRLEMKIDLRETN